MLQKRSRTLSVNPFKRLTRQLRNIPSQAKNFVPGAFPLFLLFLFIFLMYNLFAIRKTECLLNNHPCPTEVVEKMNKYLGSNVLFLNQKELSSSIKASFPVEKVGVGFKVFNTLSIKLEGRLSSINVQVFLVHSLPQISLDINTGSTESGIVTIKPTDEINHFIGSVSLDSFEIWDSGLMTPTASSESKIKYLFTSKPDTNTIKSIYSMIKIVEKYLSVDQVLILDTRVFLRQTDQPDIIVSVPFDEENLVQALQSFAYLSTIKKDVTVIDLRFKNPILR